MSLKEEVNTAYQFVVKLWIRRLHVWHFEHQSASILLFHTQAVKYQSVSYNDHVNCYVVLVCHYIIFCMCIKSVTMVYIPVS